MYKRIFQAYADLNALTHTVDGYPITVRLDNLSDGYGGPDTFVVEGPTRCASEIDALAFLFSID